MVALKYRNQLKDLHLCRSGWSGRSSGRSPVVVLLVVLAAVAAAVAAATRVTA